MTDTPEPPSVTQRPDSAPPDDEEAVLGTVLAELERERQLRQDVETKLRAASTTPGGPNGPRGSESDVVLGTVLAELERERNQRRDVETKLRAREATDRSTRDSMVTLRAQRDAFLSMIETLTGDNDAAAFASASPSETLPLHEIHLLEIMPWDERVRENVAKKVDEVYEWHVFDAASNAWSNAMKEFPDDFQSLPVVKPAEEGTTKGGGKGRRNNNEPAPKAVVLTDGACTQILNVRDGYPLPTRGTWKWVGGWKVELKHADGAPCDQDGWTYASQPKLLVSNAKLGFASDSSFGHQASPPPAADGSAGDGGETTSSGSGSGGRIYRRRRWTRLRTLVGYPSVSKKSESCLRLSAENASLELGATKLRDRLLKMQEELSEHRAFHLDLQRKTDKTTADLKLAEERIQTLERREVVERACAIREQRMREAGEQLSKASDDRHDVCHPEPVDVEPTKSFAFWHGIVGPKKERRMSDTDDRATEPSTSDEDSVQSLYDETFDRDSAMSVDDGEDAHGSGAFHWKMIGGGGGGGGGALLDKIVSTIPVKPMHPLEQLKEERLEDPALSKWGGEIELEPSKTTGAQHRLCQPTISL